MENDVQERQPRQKLLVVDGNSILNRAFFGVAPLNTADGRFTNAIYGFLGTLNRVYVQEDPQSVAVAFDERGGTFRHRMYDGYKAQRKGMPKELAEQLAPTKEILTLLGFPVVTCPGYEADDILGTLSVGAAKAGWQCVLLTGDRDSLQLVNTSVQVLYASAKKGAESLVCYDVAAVEKQYGLPPSRMVDLKALMGDSSDNIPGAAGIGPKTATTLLQQYGSLTEIYASLEAISPRQREKLKESKDIVEMSRKLAEICCDAPLPSDPEQYRLRPCQSRQARAFFGSYALSSMEKRWEGFLQRQAQGGQGDAAGLTKMPSLETGQLAQVKTLTEVPETFWQSTVAFAGNWDAENRWIWGAFLTKDRVYCPLPKEIPSLLEQYGKRLWVWQSKPIYHQRLQNGEAARDMEPFAFTGELAAYLLNPSAGSYDLLKAAGEYSVIPAVFAQYPSSLPQEETWIKHLGALWQTMAVLAARLREIPQLESLLRNVEEPLSLTLAKMEREGFALDTEGLRAYGEGLKQELKTLTEEIYADAGVRFNLNSPKQLGHILFEVLGLPPSKKTKTGYSTSAQVLEELAPLHPMVDKLLRSRKLSKLISTYVEGLQQQVAQDGRVHSTFLQTEARTGRISSTEPNLQNIPVRTPEGAYLRRFFHSREGWFLVGADYSQIELRILAHMAGDEAMLEAFRQGMDVHTLTASQVFGVSEKEISREMRSRAKAVNFGIVYGIGAFSLSRDIGVTVKEADAYIKGYLQTYPGVASFMQSCIQQGTERGFVETMLGRRRYVPELTVSNKVTRALGERIAMNSPVQGSAADIIKIAMVNVSRRLERENMRTRLILQVHDELLLESPAEECQKAAEILRWEMENAFPLDVPLTVDVSVRERWEK